MNVPDRAIYKCPQHGLFIVQTDGIVWKERCCTHMIRSAFPQDLMEYPCGILSPLAHSDDPDLSTKPVAGMDSGTLATLREVIARIREDRAAARETADDTPNFIFGGKNNRRNGKPFLPAAPEVDQEQVLFEQNEREKMRAAMAEGWND